MSKNRLREIGSIMKITVLVIFLLHLLCCYGKGLRVSRVRKLTPLKVMAPVFWAVQEKQPATMNCPLRSGIVKMYKYLRRVKTGSELYYANKKLTLLLGLKFKWFKDNKAIRHHRTAWSMKLNGVRPADAGVYTCKVFTSKGGAVRNFTLKVYEKPRYGQPVIEGKQKNLSLRSGATAILECLCTNTQTRPRIQWLKWNRSDKQSNDIKENYLLRNARKSYEVVNSKLYERFNVLKRINDQKLTWFGYRLTLRNVTVKDSGIYTCYAGNDQGTAHRNFMVSVQSTLGIAPHATRPKKSRPRFIAYPASSSAKLKCYITGDLPITYQWYKNGERLTGRRLDPNLNTSTWYLRLREAVPSDSGVYTCVAKNPYGTLKHNFTVKILKRIRSSPILVPNYPKNVSVAKGEDAVLKCIEIVSGLLPDYRWYKWHSVPASYPRLDVNNASQYTKIDPIHHTTINEKNARGVIQHGVKLTLKNITENDTGLYTCVVRNHIGYEYSSAFVSLKNEGAPKFVQSTYRPAVINIPSINHVNMDCRATGNPKPSIQWFKDDKLLNMSNKGSGFVLKLHNLRPENSGNYSCLVSNTRGSISHTFNVIVQERLFSRPIILPPRKTSLQIGGKYELRCMVVSSEPLEISWVRNLDQQKLTHDKNPKTIERFVYSATYTIPQVSMRDMGVYLCIAKNKFGSAQRKFQVQT